MKFLWTTNTPSPYKVNFLNLLSKKFDINVVFEKDKSNLRNENWYSNNFLFNYKFLTNFTNVNIFKYLIKELKNKYDYVVITNYNTKFSVMCKLVSKLYHKKIILIIDGGIIKKDNFLKKTFKKFLISNFDLYLCSGNESAKYLKWYGADESKIRFYHFTSFTADELSDHYKMKNLKQDLRQELQIKEDKIVLSVGQFIHRKGFDVLLRAARNIENVGFYIVGGKVTEEYENLVVEYNLKNIHFLDYMDTPFLNKYYVCSDVFVLPTREDIWGLVINEAMSFGLPVITTKNCIAGLELIDSKFLYDAEDDSQLHDLICKLLFDSKELEKQSVRNFDKISNYTLEQMALDVYNILK